jgi:hypothetical protein
VVGTFLELWAANKDRTMNYADALQLRDRAIELELLNTLAIDQRENAREVIRRAIDEASRHWEKEHLPSIVGADLTKEFIDRLHKEQIG